MIRVLLADDHALVRAGIRSLLQAIDSIAVVAEAGNGADAILEVGFHQPHVVLMDVAMETMNGLEATTAIKRRYPDVHVIILSMYLNEAYVEQALHAGASGYLLKDAESAEMERALLAVMRGEIYLCTRVSTQLVESYLKRGTGLGGAAAAARAAERIQLTARQKEILQCIAEGNATKEIAHRLGISPKTVEAHRMQLMERLGIRDIASLVRYAIRIGLITIDK
jgi:DNA-binding NarL/FixJ family response regulator